MKQLHSVQQTLALPRPCTTNPTKTMPPIPGRPIPHLVLLLLLGRPIPHLVLLLLLLLVVLLLLLEVLHP